MIKKGLYLLIGIFVFLLSLNSFVSASLFCTGNLECMYLDESNCNRIGVTYGGNCAWNSGSSTCSGIADCSFLDGTTQGDCENYDYCTWSCTDTCSSLGYECGLQNVCGVSVNCSVCAPGNMCTYGKCYGDNTPRIAFWFGKVNEHVTANGVWVTDPDGYSGAEYDYPEGRIEYCQRFYPTTSCVKNYSVELITTWMNGINTSGDLGPYTATKQSYECVQDISECPDCSGKVCGDDGIGGSCGDCSKSQTCVAGSCVCTAYTDSELCSSLERNCGSVTALDNCGISRTVNCGTCATGTCENGVCVGSTCGDGEISGSETCDNGVNNAISCSTYYGSSCSFCSSATCQTVTVTGPYCGDGICTVTDETCSDCSADCGCSTDHTCYSGVCELNCQLDSASWNTTSITEGDQVQLIVSGNCAGRKIIFQIYEKDGLFNADDPITDYGYLNPPFIYFPSTGTTAFTTWTAVMVDDTDGGQEDPPEYYFSALAVTSNGEFLSAATSSQSAVTDPLLLTVEEDPYCGDGTIQSSNGETCDSGTSNTNTCNADYGDYCLYCSSANCQVARVTGPYCGDGIIQSSEGETCDGTTLGGATCPSGYTGTPVCNADCTINTSNSYCVPPCLISSATWSTGSVEEGTAVGLNVQTTNCNNGEIVSFVIKEDDTIGDDDVITNPINTIINSNTASGIWTAEWQEEGWPESDPPEYYFTVTVDGNSLQSSTPELTVTEGIQCVGVSYCSDYSTKTSCEADRCDTGEASAPSNICTGKFNSETGCYDYVTCGCAWNDDSDECESSWDSEVSCGTCGNTVRDFGEECDDGNTVSGDGCSSSCIFESNIDPPCALGLTLCNDNTCSLNCEDTDTAVADCNYDDVCDSDEGCTCSDCNSEEDTCQEGLLCNIIDSACCTSISDDICNIYCSYIDPDCSGTCGNGFEETGEQCDLGIKNEVTGSGCTEECEYEIITAPCPEGTELCSDGTCSLNCFSTGEGTTCDHDNTCDTDEGCGCSDCNLEIDTCQTGLICSSVDQACCDTTSDNYCNTYCSYSDPDCTAEALSEDVFGVGKCSYTENSGDTCEDDGILVRSLSANWTWSTNNTFTSNPDGADYWETETGVFRYDPLDFSGIRNSEKCSDIEDTLVCPASVEVPFELSVYGAISVIIIIALFYIFYFLKEKKKNNKTAKRK